MSRIMKSGFYYTNPKRKTSIEPLNLFSKVYYYTFCATIAIIIMSIFPMISLWFSYDFLWLPMFWLVSKLGSRDRIFPLICQPPSWVAGNPSWRPTYEREGSVSRTQCGNAMTIGYLIFKRFLVMCWVIFMENMCK